MRIKYVQGICATNIVKIYTAIIRIYSKLDLSATLARRLLLFKRKLTFYESDRVCECWTLIRPYCDLSRRGRDLPYLKIVQKQKLHYFRKTPHRSCLTGLWAASGPEYVWVQNMQIVCIYQGSKHTRVLNIQIACINHGSKYARVLNMQIVWIYQASEYGFNSDKPGLHRLLNGPDIPE